MKGSRQQLVAIEFETSLDMYELAYAAWINSPELTNFRAVDAQLEKMRAMREELPSLASELVKLVIAHADLSAVHIQMATSSPGRRCTAKEIAAIRNLHCDAIMALRAQCRKLRDGD